jgi:hypothetical protein
MKVGTSTPKKSPGGSSHALVQPPIPFARTEEAKKGAEETLKFKLLSNPTKKDSPTSYKMVINLLRTGTPERVYQSSHCC